MQRSAGITVSAVLVLIGSTLTIFLAALMALGSAFMSHSGAPPGLPFNLKYILLAEAFFVFGFGAWGLGCGVGLLKTKQWARISLLIYSAFLVLLSLPTAVLMAVLPAPDTPDASLPPMFMPLLRYGLSSFYAAFAALGGFWLYFFNTKDVKAQFGGLQPALQPVQGLPLELPLTTAHGEHRVRPVSVTIIAWFMLVGVMMAPLGLLLLRGLFHAVDFPLFFLGFFLFGRAAATVSVGWWAVQLAAAIGLLKLKNWARWGAMGLQCLALLNSLLLLCVPANRRQFESLMESLNATMRFPGQSAAPVFPAWTGLAGSVPIALLILWFLMKEKTAFRAATS